MAREGRKRLAIDIPEQLDCSMRIAAKKKWMTLSIFVQSAIAEKIVREFGKTALFEGYKIT